MSSSRSPIAPGQTLAGKYRIDKELGSGSMGVVVRAWHVGLDQPVAVKFLFPEFARHDDGAERFRREARAAARIRSEHVTQVLDFGTWGDPPTPYIVMEHLEGRDLSAELSRLGCLPPKDAIRFVLEACEAIAEAHVHGIIHRDLKPANLFLHQRGGHDPIVKVLDFGISKVASVGSKQFSLTDTSTLMGSPAYMSPEQLESSRDVDVRADIWSLGVILHELVMGSIPFGGGSVPQLVRSILAGDREPLTHRDPSLGSLEAIVACCLEQDRTNRYANVPALCAALRKCGGLPAPRTKRPRSAISSAVQNSVPHEKSSFVGKATSQFVLTGTGSDLAKDPPAPSPSLLTDSHSSGSVRPLQGIAPPLSRHDSSPPPGVAHEPEPSRTSAVSAWGHTHSTRKRRWPVVARVGAATTAAAALSAGVLALFVRADPAPERPPQPVEKRSALTPLHPVPSPRAEVKALRPQPQVELPPVPLELSPLAVPTPPQPNPNKTPLALPSSKDLAAAPSKVPPPSEERPDKKQTPTPAPKQLRRASASRPKARAQSKPSPAPRREIKQKPRTGRRRVLTDFGGRK